MFSFFSQMFFFFGELFRSQHLFQPTQGEVPAGIRRFTNDEELPRDSTARPHPQRSFSRLYQRPLGFLSALEYFSNLKDPAKLPRLDCSALVPPNSKKIVRSASTLPPSVDSHPNSFSLYLHTFDDRSIQYIGGSLRNAELLPFVYPGWKMRVYADDSIPSFVIENLQARCAEVVQVRNLLLSQPTTAHGLRSR